MNNVTLQERLTHDVEYGETAGGSGYARFALAVRNYSRKQEDGSPTTDFFPCVVFGDMARTAARGMKKGGRVTVNGRIEINSYTARDGSPRMAVQVVVREFDIIDYAATDGGEYVEEATPKNDPVNRKAGASVDPFKRPSMRG